MVRKTAFRSERCFVRLRAVLAVLLCAAMLLTSSGLVPLSVLATSADDSVSLNEKVRCADGNTYKVTVTFTEETGIPHDAELTVSEITHKDELYTTYLDRTQSALHMEDDFTYALLLDISLVDKDDENLHFQPEEGTTVDVRIRMAGSEMPEDVSVVHFPDGTHMPQILPQIEIEDKDISFAADGFSAYAIVSGPTQTAGEWSTLETMQDLIDHASEGIYIGHVDGYYFTNSITRISSSRTGITKTKPPQETPAPAAVPYFFEQVGENSNQFRIYCIGTNGSHEYVRQNGNSLSLTTQANATTFTIEEFTAGTPGIFRIQGNNSYCWNMQGGASGASFAAYNAPTDVNARMQFWIFDEADEDIFGLDGQSFGLMNYTGGVTGRAMMANETDGGALQALDLAVLGKLEDRDDQLFVPNSSDISMWTFDWVESDRYRLRTVSNGSTKYLHIDNNGLSLVSAQEDASAITVIPGSGTHLGQICLKCGANTLTYSGTLATGFGINGAVGSEWLYFVKEEELTQESVPEEPETEDEVVVYDENEEDPDKITITRNISGELVVSGQNIEKLVKMTNFLNDEAVRRFQYIWRIKNLDEKLREKGAKEGDTIHIGEMEFEFRD